LVTLGASRAELAAPAPTDETRTVLQVLLEAFWPSRRVVQFDEFCRPAA